MTSNDSSRSSSPRYDAKSPASKSAASVAKDQVDGDGQTPRSNHSSAAKTSPASEGAKKSEATLKEPEQVSELEDNSAPTTSNTEPMCTGIPQWVIDRVMLQLFPDSTPTQGQPMPKMVANTPPLEDQRAPSSNTEQVGQFPLDSKPTGETQQPASEDAKGRDQQQSATLSPKAGTQPTPRK